MKWHMHYDKLCKIHLQKNIYLQMTRPRNNMQTKMGHASHVLSLKLPLIINFFLSELITF